MFYIEREGHHSGYTCISNELIKDKRLSLAARGFFAVVLSLSSDWDFSVSGMARLVGVNKDTVLRYIRELEELGYVRIESKDRAGRFVRKSYIFYEKAVPQNTAPEHSAEVDEVTENTAPKISVPKNTAQSNNNISNNKNKQIIDSFGRQINADDLREEYGADLIGKVVGVIADCMKAKSRIISGVRMDNAELRRVFGEVSEEDIRSAIGAIKGKKPDNFAGYFGSVLFNQIKGRLESSAQKRETNSSLDIQAIDEAVMAKYRRDR